MRAWPTCANADDGGWQCLDSGSRKIGESASKVNKNRALELQIHQVVGNFQP